MNSSATKQASIRNLRDGGQDGPAELRREFASLRIMSPVLRRRRATKSRSRSEAQRAHATGAGSDLVFGCGPVGEDLRGGTGRNGTAQSPRNDCRRGPGRRPDRNDVRGRGRCSRRCSARLRPTSTCRWTGRRPKRAAVSVTRCAARFLPRGHPRGARRRDHRVDRIAHLARGAMDAADRTRDHLRRAASACVDPVAGGCCRTPAGLAARPSLQFRSPPPPGRARIAR